MGKASGGGGGDFGAGAEVVGGGSGSGTLDVTGGGTVGIGAGRVVALGGGLGADALGGALGTDALGTGVVAPGAGVPALGGTGAVPAGDMPPAEVAREPAACAPPEPDVVRGAPAAPAVRCSASATCEGPLSTAEQAMMEQSAPNNCARTMEADGS